MCVNPLGITIYESISFIKTPTAHNDG